MVLFLKNWKNNFIWLNSVKIKEFYRKSWKFFENIVKNSVTKATSQNLWYKSLRTLVINWLWARGKLNMRAKDFHLKVMKMKKNEEPKDYRRFFFYVVNVTDEHRKPRFKRKLRGQIKDSICAKFCSKLWFESNWIRMVLKAITLKQSSKQSLPKM